MRHTTARGRGNQGDWAPQRIHIRQNPWRKNRKKPELSFPIFSMHRLRSLRIGFTPRSTEADLSFPSKFYDTFARKQRDRKMARVKVRYKR